jgi:6-phosphogluconolactonase
MRTSSNTREAKQMTQTGDEGALVYIGTYTRGKSEGIYVYRMDPSTGALEYASAAKGIDNPSYVAPHPQGGYLYAVTEAREFGGRPSGAVNAFAIDPKTGGLTFLNRQPSEGTEPCYVSVEHTGRFALVANYGSGSVAILPIQVDGSLGPASDFVQHEGSSVLPRRQAGPHGHSIVVDPNNRYALACDLGLDKVMVYELDLDKGKLVPNEEPWAKVAPGAGPRHSCFHPNGKFYYVINEIGNTVTAFTYEETRGALREIQTVPTLPDDFEGRTHTSDMHFGASGKFLYGSNRGHDSIAIFAVDEGTGKLTFVDRESTQGKTPRGFVIDPTGTFLLAANQNSDSIVTFRIDEETGKLTPTGHVTEVGVPVCLKFLPVAS